MSAIATEVFDICVVGAGLWGSAAAKYCSEWPGISVCLIGPSEPVTKENYESRSVFGAHYDEGRVFSGISRSFEWGELGRRAAQKFSDIEQMTGVHFYSDVGVLWLTAHDGSLSRKLLDGANQTGISVEVLNQTKLRESFNFLSVEKITQATDMGTVGIFQANGAGHLSPRKLLLAQQTLAQRQGCRILDDIVDDLSHDPSNNVFTLATEAGTTINAKKVLLCTGASIAVGDLLPAGLQLDVTAKTQVIVLLELTENDRDRLRGMPSLHVHEGETDLGQDCYILPPIQYPNGKWYLKIGHGKVGEKDMTTKEQMKAWYCGHGDQPTSDRLLQCLQSIVPDLKPLSMHTDTCVTTTTPTRLLYCDMVSPGLGVLVGGNGVGAKSSDEIGHMAANMVLKGEWDYDMPREKFRVKWKPKTERS